MYARIVTHLKLDSADEVDLVLEVVVDSVEHLADSEDIKVSQLRTDDRSGMISTPITLDLADQEEEVTVDTVVEDMAEEEVASNKEVDSVDEVDLEELPPSEVDGVEVISVERRLPLQLRSLSRMCVQFFLALLLRVTYYLSADPSCVCVRLMN